MNPALITRPSALESLNNNKNSNGGSQDSQTTSIDDYAGLKDVTQHPIKRCTQRLNCRLNIVLERLNLLWLAQNLTHIFDAQHLLMPMLKVRHEVLKAPESDCHLKLCWRLKVPVLWNDLNIFHKLKEFWSEAILKNVVGILKELFVLLLLLLKVLFKAILKAGLQVFLIEKQFPLC